MGPIMITFTHNNVVLEKYVADPYELEFLKTIDYIKKDTVDYRLASITFNLNQKVIEIALVKL